MRNKSIIIRGFSSASALGINKIEILTNYRLRKSFISYKTIGNKFIPVGTINENIEKEIKQLIISEPKLKRLDRTAILALLTSKKAFEESELTQSDSKLNIGVSIGSSRGATSTFESIFSIFDKDPYGKIPINTSPLTTLGNISSTVASYLKLTGPFISHSSTCSTGLQSIANAIAWLKAGMADVFIAGASEAPLTPFTIAQIEALGIYSKDSGVEFPCRPLDSSENPQNTFVLGEAASSFIMQAIDHDKINKAQYLVQIESIGYAFETPPSLTGISSDGKPLIKSMSMAIENMITDKNIDLILLHAPGTIKGDNAELAAIKQVFGENPPAVFSGKWIMGHTFATSALLNLELAILCITQGFIPRFPYPVTVSKIPNKPIKKVMINATGFGGNAMSLIVSAI
ncbi:MAG: beta-ketoacyl synthase N-terminal-like domain-containing protein [Bacteroidota bacterium]|nr:beta-ketoacyl synthase N-terminal-like domain-containing protein [Bacteroidota bacterium]